MLVNNTIDQLIISLENIKALNAPEDTKQIHLNFALDLTKNIRSKPEQPKHNINRHQLVELTFSTLTDNNDDNLNELLAYDFDMPTGSYLLVGGRSEVITSNRDITNYSVPYQSADKIKVIRDYGGDE